MLREFYKDFYGCAASINHRDDGTVVLCVMTPGGKLIHKKSYSSRRGARIAMGKLSDGWTKRDEWR